MLLRLNYLAPSSFEMKAAAGQSLLSTMVLFVTITLSEQISQKFREVSSSNCICHGYLAIYECTVMRRYGTVWRGSAFNCMNRDDEIFLLVNNDTDSLRLKECNDGAIIGRVISVDERFYTSQLNITVSPDLIGKTVECAYDNGSRAEVLIGLSNIYTTTSPYPPPNNVSPSFLDLVLKQITFTWSPVAPDCPAIHYNINASNCGSCPTTTNHTNITCTDVPTNGDMCVFAVETVVCGDVTGFKSEPLQINFTETLNQGMHQLTDKVSTASLSILIAGVTTLLATIVIVIVICCCMCATKRQNNIKTTSRSNSNRSLSLQNDATSHNENKDTYEYSQLVETPLNLKSLLKKLQGHVSKQWYQFGLTLGLPMDVLEGFNMYSEEDCLVEVLDYWLNHHPSKPTWQEITDAQNKIETFNVNQDSSTDETKEASVDIPPPKPPRRTSSVTMKRTVIPVTDTSNDDEGHEYEAID